MLYKTNGAWGTGTGAPLTAANVDGNFYEADSRLRALETYPGGPSIQSISQVGTTLTITKTDGTTDTFTIPMQEQTPAPVLNVAGTSLTLGVSHRNHYLRFTNSSGCTVHVVSETEESFLVGDEISFRCAGGPVTVVHDSSVQIFVPDGFQSKLSKLHATATIKFVGDDDWDMFGLLDLEENSA
jgi:hypothetical protein